MRRAVVLFLVVVVGATVGWLLVHSNGQSQFQDVEKALKNRKFKEASDLLDHYLDEHPNDSTALLLAAQTARRNDILLRAKEYLRSFEELNGSKDATDLERRLGRIQSGDFHDAPELLIRCETGAEAAETSLILEAFLKGVAKYIDGPANRQFVGQETLPDMSKAIWAADQWLARRTSRADQSVGFFWRGKINKFVDNHASAVQDMRKAVEMDAENIPAHLSLVTLIAQENPEEAIRFCRFVLEKRPDSVEARFMLATGLSGLGRFDESRRLLDGLLQNDPNNLQVLLERANIAVEALQSEEAEPYLRRAEGLAPNYPSVLNLYYHFFLLKGNAEQAKKYRERFTQIKAEEKRKSSDLEKKGSTPIKN